MSDRDHREERDDERLQESEERVRSHENDDSRDHDRDRDGDSRRRGGSDRGDDDDRDRKTVKRGSGELCPQSLLVRNISYRVTSGEIRKMMEKYGEVRDVYIPLDHHTGRSRGFAFVEFYDARDAR